MINVGIVGFGYWGPNLVRIFCEAAETQVVAVTDMREERLDEVRRRYPAIRAMTEVQDLFDDPTIDAIAIATPVHTHFALGLRALESGSGARSA